MSKLENNFNDLNLLKIKVYHITCPRHPCYIYRRDFLRLPMIDFSNHLENHDIIDELRTSNFTRYATIFLWINYRCLCRQQDYSDREIICQIMNAFKENEQHLRYITKIVFVTYDIAKRNAKIALGMLTKGFHDIEKSINCDSNDNVASSLINDLQNVELEPGITSDGETFITNDFTNYYNNIQMDNLILVQYTTYYKANSRLAAIHANEYDLMMLCYQIMQCQHKSASEFIFNEMDYKNRRIGEKAFTLFVAHTFSNIDLYFFNFNPALAIIINNRFLNSREHEERSGSDLDVEKLCNLYKITKSLYFPLNDFTKDDFKQCFEWLRNADLKPFKNIYLIIMSHGSEKGVIYTEDDSKIYLQDIIDYFKQCKTEEEAVKYIFVVACRGEYDELLAEPDDPVPEDKCLNLDIPKNMAIILSAREGRVSYRHRLEGTRFIKEISENILYAKHQQNLLAVIEKNLNNDEIEIVVKQNTCPITKQPIALTEDLKRKLTTMTKSFPENLKLLRSNESGETTVRPPHVT